MIEMLVVVAVIVMVASSIVVGVGSFGRFRASSDLGTFNSFVRSEFMKAVRDRQYIRIAVSMEDGAYWSEISETPFFISSGEKTLEIKERTEEMIEKMESGKSSDPYENMGAALGADSIFQKAKLMGSEGDLENDDLYNYENFIPDRRSIREVLKPEFEAGAEKRKFNKNLIVTAFYAYHTPEIVTPDTLKEDADKEKDRNMYVYIFPEGRIEPFYLSLGKDDEGELFTYAFIASDMFLNIKIKPGSFEEEVQDFTDLFEDQDAEGK